ncbi:hypothetical protein ELQ35_12565 [Peribacillus cavernae]|uniref:Endolytic transglycosylase MltG n=1 Tax=Peribacillus cavernae TaxID=1674310 RepID=A0A3S0UCK2_9BACI|nr:endolytic transglycosylase MltG [Peribacillus cavernae]MDQ0218306.1 hypothetical protein [Peribacillus cavernae]RUQ28412.1 hypothetical protein ELQ35_12565 [Peribacillus cavernae]
MNKGTIQAFAAGIILSTGVIAGYGHWFQPNDDQAISLQEAKRLLKQEGYEVTPSLKEEETRETAKSKEPESTEKQLAEKSRKPIPKQDIGEKEGNHASQTKKSEATAAYTLSIRSGMTTGDIAVLLANEGILKDASAFEHYLEQNELSKRIQIGEYVLTDNMTIQQAAKTITK